MDFTPHTATDVSVMLDKLGVSDVSDLFSHLPGGVGLGGALDLPVALAEADVMAHIDLLGSRNRQGLVCFAGGGVYDHYLPPVVRSLTMRPEFVTSYTPYQSEVSQGVLQALFEYQSMIAAITGLPVANASLYDGASAGAEAVNLATRATSRNTVWVSAALPPPTRRVIDTFAKARGIEVAEHPVVGGRTVWQESTGAEPAAVMFAQPNYLGVIENYGEAVRFAHDRGALALVQVDPMLLGVLRTPGDAGCDIAFAEGQPLGSPMSFGGPGLGIFAVTSELLRRIPGRLVGRTVDEAGAVAYTLTLRTREQDIRQEKATSNICTNQGLNAVAAAVHLAWLGPNGLVEAGRQSIQRAHYLAERLGGLPGVSVAAGHPFAREFPLSLPKDAQQVVQAMAERGYLAGIPLEDTFGVENGLLVAVTERRDRDALDGYTSALGEVITDA